MSFLAINYHLSGLKEGNKTLIKAYKILYKRKFQEEETKEEIKERIALRTKFHKELDQCIKNYVNYRNGIFSERSLLSTIRLVAKWGIKIYYMPFMPTRENCENNEHENLKLYYEILYIPELPKEITDLLLEQKGLVECYLLGKAY